MDDIRPDEDGLSRTHCAVGTIRYSKDEVGELLYVKSSFTRDEPESLKEYRARNPGFPHESTADQFFSEEQFEAYRRHNTNSGWLNEFSRWVNTEEMRRVWAFTRGAYSARFQAFCETRLGLETRFRAERCGTSKPPANAEKPLGLEDDVEWEDWRISAIVGSDDDGSQTSCEVAHAKVRSTRPPRGRPTERSIVHLSLARASRGEGMHDSVRQALSDQLRTLDGHADLVQP